MKPSNAKLKFYTDAMIVSSFAPKTAGGFDAGDLINTIKEYFSAHIKPGNEKGSLFAILAPAGFAGLFSLMGMPWIGRAIGIVLAMYGSDISEIVGSIINSLEGKVGDGKVVNSEEVDNAVENAVESHTAPIAKTQSQLLRDMRILKLSMINSDGFNKFALGGNKGIATKKAPTWLSTVLKLVFKIAFASAGFMVAGDIANKLIGRPNALDGTLKDNKPTEEYQATHTSQPIVPARPPSKQTKFKLQPTYKDVKRTGNWVVNTSNNASSIENMLIGFAKTVYQGLNGLENTIISDPKFQVIARNITSYNKSSSGDSLVFMPKMFTSEKDVVDYFIDDVAEAAK